ncbi:MAG: hypothetical protein OET44_19880 [Gammaproteobacteria bacterium]|nr:hypothetical protein [Gammaproteobacteria bacterium]
MNDMEYTMSARKKFAWGGLGALTPIVTTFLIVDVDTIIGYLGDVFGEAGNPYLIAGYGLRVLGLFAVGGVWACLHKQEYDPKKLFQLGIVAPAMITATINASNVYNNAHPEHEQMSAVRITLVSSAYAGEKTAGEQRDSSAFDQLIKGFLGQRGK